MPQLDKKSTEALKAAVNNCKDQWLLACLPEEHSASPISGPVGLFDWRLHGQVSRMARRKMLQSGELCLVSGPKRLGGASLLLYIYEKGAKSSNLVSRLKKLGITSLSVEESSFPKDFFSRLEQNLDKEGLSWKKLEWETP